MIANHHVLIRTYQASGNIGVPIVRELLAQGFTVTVLARASSSASYPAGVSAVRRVDFSSVPDLTAALRGQDAVVSALADHGVRGGAQRTLADATAAAGVRRFVPSEFGMHVPQVAAAAADGSATPTERAMADFARPKIELQAHLDELAARDENFSWTGLNVGSFFDWVSVYFCLWREGYKCRQAYGRRCFLICYILCCCCV